MKPIHPLRYSINIAPVDETQPTHSEINIDVVEDSVIPIRNPILSPCESIRETEEFDDPYDYNIIIVETDEETDVVSPDKEPVIQSTPFPKWRLNPPFDNDFSYDYLSILSRNTQIGVSSHLHITLQTLDSGLWSVDEKQLDQEIDEVVVTDDTHFTRMCLHFSDGNLHGNCSFWSENGRVEGEWESGRCKWKTIVYEQSRLIVRYENELPVSVEDVCSNPPIVYQYRDGFFTNRWICDQRLHVKEMMDVNGQPKEVEMISSANPSFHREGKTFVYESNQLRKLDLYSRDAYLETLRWYQGNMVMVMRGSVGVYYGSFNSSCVDGPVTGFGEIYEGNGNRYQGSVENGIPHGRGEYFVKNQLMYSGEFRYGIPFGKGVIGSGNEDSFLFGYRLSDGASFGEYFSGLVIKELCGHLMVENRLDGSKLKNVFPEYREDYRKWDQYMCNRRRRTDEVQVRQRPPNEVARRMQGIMVSFTGPYERSAEQSFSWIQSGNVRNQRMSYGNDSASVGVGVSSSMNSTQSNLPHPSLSTTFLFDSVNSTQSNLPHPSLSTTSLNSTQSTSPYRNSSASPTTTPTPFFSFTEDALKSSRSSFNLGI